MKSNHSNGFSTLKTVSMTQFLGPQEFAGHVTVANIVSIDNTEDNFLPVKKRKVPLPKGLKIRNEPFGMGISICLLYNIFILYLFYNIFVLYLVFWL